MSDARTASLYTYLYTTVYNIRRIRHRVERKASEHIRTELESLVYYIQPFAFSLSLGSIFHVCVCCVCALVSSVVFTILFLSVIYETRTVLVLYIHADVYIYIFI